MQIELNSFLHSLTMALDYVELDIIKAARNHGKRVAVLTNLMAAEAGFSREDLFALTQAAVLHDSALSEYLNDEYKGENATLDERNMAAHCVKGEEMLSKLPGYASVSGAVLYHHERADGKGAFGRTADDTPFPAQLIHIADMADVTFSLDTMDSEKYSRLTVWLDRESGAAFSDASAALFKKAVDYDVLCSITGEGCREKLRAMLPDYTNEISTEVLREMASFFANITDYKSHFTWRHSLGIAEKAEKIGQYYGYDRETCDKLYIAGALHDVGKLLIGNDILEKPGKLTSSEYKEIQNHAMGTWNMLSGIGGLEDITRWAALHHEKLDGSGYPFGYTAEQLGKNERLMACLDIYQALREERPYKSGLSHKEAMGILNRMGDDNQLDRDILRDIDRCFDDHTSPAPHAPEAAPQTYHGEAWRCPVCGYVYEGTLPEDFICPRCEQPGSVFEQVHRE